MALLHRGRSKFEERLHRMEPWLMRGAQPQSEDYCQLFDAGIRAIVNLRKHDDSVTIEKFAPQVLAVRIPVANHHAPSRTQALTWLEFCQSMRAAWPIFVHCHAGHGRTSVFCGLVRIAQGWDFQRMLDEQQSYGFEPRREVEQAQFLEQFCDDVRAGRLTVPSL
jgi:protein tyrosine/serine phosphatase